MSFSKTLSQVAVIVICLVSAGMAQARCAGKDMLPELRSADPTGIAQVFALADAVPNARGLFWKIEKAGVSASFLYGTYHSSEAIKLVPEPVWQALDQASAAIFELSPAEQAAVQQRMASDPGFAMDMTAPPLLPTLPEGKRTAIEKAARDRGLPAEAVNFMRPWILMSLLGMPACHVRALMTGETVLDDAMIKRAESKGIPVHGLETYQEALGAFSDLKREQLVEMIMPSTDWSEREEDFFAMLLQLYKDGQPVAINEISIYLSEKLNPAFKARDFNRAMMDKLLDGRNKAWMDDLLPHLEKGNAFVGVGALHLAGNVGLIELLRAEGWTVTRLD